MGSRGRKTRAGEIVLTCMDKDGTKDGYDLEMTAAVSQAVSIPVIASGGAGNPEHLADAVLKGKADAVLAASIFHFGEYSIQERKSTCEAGNTGANLGVRAMDLGGFTYTRDSAVHFFEVWERNTEWRRSTKPWINLQACFSRRSRSLKLTRSLGLR